MATVLKTEFPMVAGQTARLPALLPTADGATKLFFNRELSLLEFHRRVLEEGFDPSNPLLERLKFLAIFSSNLDEFFMIRISGLKEEVDEDVKELSPDGMTPSEQLSAIRSTLLLSVSSTATTSPRSTTSPTDTRHSMTRASVSPWPNSGTRMSI